MFSPVAEADDCCLLFHLLFFKISLRLDVSLICRKSIYFTNISPQLLYTASSPLQSIYTLCIFFQLRSPRPVARVMLKLRHTCYQVSHANSHANQSVLQLLLQDHWQTARQLTGHHLSQKGYPNDNLAPASSLSNINKGCALECSFGHS